MKYKIDWCEVKKTGNTNGRDWSITEMTLIDEKSEKIDKVSTFDSVQPGQEIEGSILTNDKGYLNFKKADDGRKPNMDRIMDKKAGMIHEAQDVKAQNIAKAQDRSAAMWAKYNASELIANHPAYKNLEAHEIPSAIHKLADTIFNDELSPF